MKDNLMREKCKLETEFAYLLKDLKETLSFLSEKHDLKTLESRLYDLQHSIIRLTQLRMQIDLLNKLLNYEE